MRDHRHIEPTLEESRAGGLERLFAVMRARGRGAGALDCLVENAGARVLADELSHPGKLEPGWATFETTDPPEDGGRPERVQLHIEDLGGSLALAVGDDLGSVDEIEGAFATALLWTLGLAGLLSVRCGLSPGLAFLARVDAIASTAQAIIGAIARDVAHYETAVDTALRDAESLPATFSEDQGHALVSAIAPASWSWATRSCSRGRSPT